MSKFRLLLSIMLISVASLAQNGQLIHQVKAGETLYAISRMYNVSVQSLVDWNSDIDKSYAISPGQYVNIAKYEKVVKTEESADRYKKHSVKSKETLFSISKQHGISIDQLMSWNNLSANNLSIGQELIVGKANDEALFQKSYTEAALKSTNEGRSTTDQKLSAESPIIVDRAGYKNISVPSDKVYRAKFEENDSIGFEQIKSRCVANWLNDDAGNQFLALYNGVAAGSVIEVKNLLTHQTVCVKVVGRVPESELRNEISLKLSGTAARYIGALDEKFIVEVFAHKL